MSKKKYKHKHKIFRYIFFSEIKTTFNFKSNNNFITLSNKNYLPSSNALLFKKVAFIGLAINGVCFKKYFLTTIKSIMFSVWNSINTYTYIF